MGYAKSREMAKADEFRLFWPGDCHRGCKIGKICGVLPRALYILQQKESRVRVIQPGFLLLLPHIASLIAPPLVLPHGDQEAMVLIYFYSWVTKKFPVWSIEIKAIETF